MTIDSIIPKPLRMERRDDVFALGPDTAILALRQAHGSTSSPCPEALEGQGKESAETLAVARFLAECLGPATGYRLEAQETATRTPGPGAILLTTQSSPRELGPEGYSLDVTPGSVVIRASEPRGLFYGVQTLRQLLPHEIESRSIVRNVAWTAPCVSIEDRPRFAWRGFMIDSARHFLTLDFLKQFIDLLALYKINRLHWHLVDDEAWRLQLDGFPEMVSGVPAASRPGQYWSQNEGFYTKDDVREVLRYAASRYVTVHPEIEMPGHSLMTVGQHPELSCIADPLAPPVAPEVCIGSEKTEEFFRNVLAETMELFPGRYIHIGGDEAPDTRWKQCPRCRAAMKREGLSSERELQVWFMKKMSRFVRECGRVPIAWADNLALGIPEGQIVQGWQNEGESLSAVQRGFETVQSEHSFTYFYYPEDQAHFKAPEGMRTLPIEKAYSFEPVPAGAAAAESKLVVGAEACVWETVQADVQMRIFPRLNAFAEAVWSPKEARDWDGFAERLRAHLKRLDVLGVGYYRGAWARHTES